MDSQHNQFVETCENIDAAVFTGDTLYNPASLAKFEEYLARWQRAVTQHKNEYPVKEITPSASCTVGGVVRCGARLGACLQHGDDNSCHYPAMCAHKVVK